MSYSGDPNSEPPKYDSLSPSEGQFLGSVPPGPYSGSSSYGSGPSLKQTESAREGFDTKSPQESLKGADPHLWDLFSSVDADRSGAISALELQQALVNRDNTLFDNDTIKLLMNIFDTDRSGKIGFDGFSRLWRYINDWQGVFYHFDVDRSGSIDEPELAEALKQFGYNISPQLVALVEKKYASVPAIPGTLPPGITFDRFVRACIVVKTLTESFQRLDTDRDGWIRINYDTFMQNILSAP